MLFSFLGLFLPAQAQEDEDKYGNKYFYKREDTLSVMERKLPPGSINRIRQDKAFWYMDSTSSLGKSPGLKEEQGGHIKDKDKNKPEEYTPLARRSWFQTLLWIIIMGGFATFLAIYLAGSKVGLFRKKNILRDNQPGQEQMPEDIFAINYQKEIDKAVDQANYRLAVRLQFLWLLKNMSDRNLIRYTQDKTNFDYLSELQPTHFYNPFFRATRNYEYSWYGLFPVSREGYQTIKRDFDLLQQQLA